MLKAVIFDMDGVIIDSEPLRVKAVILAMQKFGLTLTEDFCYKFIGTTSVHMFETIRKDYNLSVPVIELIAANEATKKELLKVESYPIIPYVKELIQDLYNNGLKLAIASSSSMEEIKATVQTLDISSYISALISGSEVKNPKPAPDIFLKTAQELKVDPSECIVLEDSYVGVTAAKAAGMTRIGFLNSHSGIQDLSQVNFVIEGFEEINYKFVSQIYQRSKGLPVTIATTKRLIIRELTVDDIKHMYQIYQAKEVREFIDDIDDYLAVEVEKHKAYIKNVYSFYGYGYWGVFSRTTNKLIGRCGIQNNTIDGKTEIELGYLLDVNHWGYGYAVECTKSVLDYAFTELKIPRIVAVIDILNERSKKVAHHLGMKVEKEIKYNGRNCSLYVITAKDFFD